MRQNGSDNPEIVICETFLNTSYMLFRQYTSLLFWALLNVAALHATHNAGGEILYRKTGPLTVEAWIITYTNAFSVAADRDTLTICWGDGACEVLARSNGNGEGEMINAHFKKNIYLGSHTYAQAGQFTISMTDPNRNANILNVNAPNSDFVPFHIESDISFLPGAGASFYSPELMEIPLDDGVVGQVYEHVPGTFDADGDSLAFELAIPLQGPGEIVPNYVFPYDIAPGSNNNLSIDPLTGKIVWNAPQIAGHYTIAIRIKAYRDGQLVETVLRDMLIHIDSDDNFNAPPVASFSVPEGQIVDVYVGSTVEVDIAASDPNAGQLLEMSSSSGLYHLPDAAEFEITNPGNARFTWVVSPQHLREQPYQVVFKVKDDGSSFAGGATPDSDDGEGLATFKVATFRVLQTVSQRPDPLQAVSLRVYPNPMTETGVLEWPQPSPDNCRLQVSDTQGAVLLEESVSAGTTRHPLRWNTLPTGTYTVQVRDTKGIIWTGRVIKQQ